MSVPKQQEGFLAKFGYVDEAGELRVGRLVFHTLLLMLLLLGVYWSAFRVVVAMGWDTDSRLRTFLDEFGVFGVATYVYIVDLFILPMTVDIIWPFVFSWSFVKATVVLGTASVAGALTGHLVGRLLGRLPFLQRWVEVIISSDSRNLVERYGVGAIILSGLSPLPFSTICIATGVLRLPFWRVAAATSVRYGRMAVYYLIFQGFIF